MQKTKTPFIITLLILSYFMWVLFSDFLHALILGAMLAGPILPLQKKIQAKQIMGDTTLSVLLTLLIFIICILPASILIYHIAKEVLVFANETMHFLQRPDFFTETKTFLTQSFLGQKILHLTELLPVQADFNWEDIKQVSSSQVKTTFVGLAKTLNNRVSDIFSFLFHAFFMSVWIFCILQYRIPMKKFLFDLSPLPSHQEELLLTQFLKMNDATLVTNFICGLVQGIPVGILFYFFHITNFLLLTSLMIFLAFIPLLGISLVTVPASLYLFWQNRITEGMFLLSLSAIIAFFVENFLKSYMIGNKLEQINGTFIFFCMIGGLKAFGLMGLFYGPFIGILFLTTVKIYHDYYLNEKTS